MTNTDSIDWLASHVRHHDHKFQMLRRPFSVVVNGKLLAVVTDGVLMIAVEQEGEWPFAGVPEDEIAKARPFLERTPAGEPVSFEKLRVWCGLPADTPCEFCKDSRETECQGCLGSGKYPSECDACGAPHECFCRYCGGSKTKRCSCCPGDDDSAPGWLCGLLVDRIRLGRLLDLRLPKGEVRIEAVLDRTAGDVKLPQDRLHFYGPGWSAVLMAMNPEDDKTYPAFGFVVVKP